MVQLHTYQITISMESTHSHTKQTTAQTTQTQQQYTSQ